MALVGRRHWLTPLGHSLARLPLDPRMGRMLLWGAALRCLQPLAVIVAATSSGMLAGAAGGLWRWIAGAGDGGVQCGPRRDGGESRRQLDSSSDSLALLRGFEGWRVARSHNGRKDTPPATTNGVGQADGARACSETSVASRQYCEGVGLSEPALQRVEAVAEQLCRAVGAEIRPERADSVNEFGGCTGLVRLGLVLGLQVSIMLLAFV
jgi:HrpA-like RNA helicase